MLCNIFFFYPMYVVNKIIQLLFVVLVFNQINIFQIPALYGLHLFNCKIVIKWYTLRRVLNVFECIKIEMNAVIYRPFVLLALKLIQSHLLFSGRFIKLFIHFLNVTLLLWHYSNMLRKITIHVLSYSILRFSF